MKICIAAIILSVLCLSMPLRAFRAVDSLSPSTILLTSDSLAAAASVYAFTDPLEAIRAVNSAARHCPSVTLLVGPGVYWLDDPDDDTVRQSPLGNRAVPYAAEITCDSLAVIGLGEAPDDVVLAVNRGQTQGALGNFTMLHFKGRALFTENITWGNYCNVDLHYPLNPALNRPRRGKAIVQAQLGICEDTDRLFARNCRFISRLNLCPLVGARRSLYQDCYFECTDDALSGSAIYLGCDFTFFSGKPFYSTAATGAVFIDCDIRSLTSGTQYFTKMPGVVTVIDTRISSLDPDLTLRWTRDASDVRCYQSNVTLNGHPVTIDASRPGLSVTLDGTPLMDSYKISLSSGRILYNIPNLVGGTDGWDPTGQLREILDAQASTGRPLLGLPVTLTLPRIGRTLLSQGDTATLTPEAHLWGNYPAPLPPTSMSWSASSLLAMTPQGGKALVTTANSLPSPAKASVEISSAYGLTAATTLSIEPFLKDAPAFESAPTLSLGNSVVNLSYTLTPGSGQDDSYIIWYRSIRPDLSDSIAVRHGHGQAARQYQLSAPDKGYYISARVTPRRDDTCPGQPSDAASLGRPVSALNILLNPLAGEKELSTSFAEIPLRSTLGSGRRGLWHFDTHKPLDTRAHDWQPDGSIGWYYGTGVDAITGRGLVEASRGARLFYTPVRTSCRDMSVSLIAEPAKGPGQGFGSATGQYLDICVGFDPATLSGYGLRIERTADYDKAVTFTLVSYSDGRVTPLTAPVASSCFRNPCSITVTLAKNRLTATASTSAPAVTSDDDRIHPSVSLSAPLDGVASFATSLMIQHTGSTGASATLLRNLHLTWK